MSWIWNRAWKLAPARSQRAVANTSALTPTMPVSTSISAERRSSTSTMPKGACQLPGRYTPIELAWPCSCTHSSRQIEIPSPARLEIRLMRALSGRRFSPSSSISAAVSSGSRMGATISWFITLIL